MKTKYINLKEEYNEEKIKEVAQDILNGELVIFPTETVYGIGANALNDAACKNIFKAKGRAGDNPLIVHVNNVDMIKQLVEEPNEVEKILINTFCPGPFTLILKAKNIIPKSVTAGLDTVGIRMPSNKIASKLIEYAGVPIAAPSANVSGRPSGTKIEDILKEFDEIIGLEEINGLWEIDIFGNNRLGKIENLDRIILSNEELADLQLDVLSFPDAIGLNRSTMEYNDDALEAIKELDAKWKESMHGKTQIVINNAQMILLHNKACQILDENIPM